MASWPSPPGSAAGHWWKQRQFIARLNGVIAVGVVLIHGSANASGIGKGSSAFTAAPLEYRHHPRNVVHARWQGQRLLATAQAIPEPSKIEDGYIRWSFATPIRPRFARSGGAILIGGFGQRVNAVNRPAV
jgi:hypothetical protein